MNVEERAQATAQIRDAAAKSREGSRRYTHLLLPLTGPEVSWVLTSVWEDMEEVKKEDPALSTRLGSVPQFPTFVSWSDLEIMDLFNHGDSESQVLFR